MSEIVDSVTDSAKLLVNFAQGVVSSAEIQTTASDTHQSMNLDNIQGDIILGLPKTVERFMFYEILDVLRFRRNLIDLLPMITTMRQVVSDLDTIKEAKRAGQNDLLPISGTNIAFSHIGLRKIGIEDNLEDQAFEKGQREESRALGDPRDPSKPSDPNWIPQFKEKIDFVVLVTGDNTVRIAERVQHIEDIFGTKANHPSVKQIIALDGAVRPGQNRGHEHFGYRDGISQPAIENFGIANPGPAPVPAGIALCGNPGDPKRIERPVWALDGSLLVFRYLEQLVPEFDDFVMKNPISIDGLPRDKGSELLGARMFGRWKSGAPIDITPLADDPTLGGDASRNNNFDFSTDHSQHRCPFAAHVRKSNPRSDLAFLGGTTIRKIWRQGIPFGPEVTDEERQQAKTIHPRGLLFACYQSSIDNGFSFVQQAWCNTVTFPPKLLPPTISGFDPIIGQNGGKPRNMYDPEVKGSDLKLPFNFVVPKGGEYFFSPSIRALAEFATRA